MVSDMFYCGNALMEFDAVQRFIGSFIYTEQIDGSIRIQEFRPFTKRLTISLETKLLFPGEKILTA